MEQFQFQETLKGYVILSKQSTNYSSRLTIPCKHNGKPVVAIGENAFNPSFNASLRGVHSVHIPKSIKTVDMSAFKGCTGLDTITGMQGVTNINFGAFLNTNITHATVPKDCKIEQYAFDENCQVVEESNKITKKRTER